MLYNKVTGCNFNVRLKALVSKTLTEINTIMFTLL
jgi:hypothetical protein